MRLKNFTIALFIAAIGMGLTSCNDKSNDQFIVQGYDYYILQEAATEDDEYYTPNYRFHMLFASNYEMSTCRVSSSLMPLSGSLYDSYFYEINPEVRSSTAPFADTYTLYAMSKEEEPYTYQFTITSDMISTLGRIQLNTDVDDYFTYNNGIITAKLKGEVDKASTYIFYINRKLKSGSLPSWSHLNKVMLRASTSEYTYTDAVTGESKKGILMKSVELPTSVFRDQNGNIFFDELYVSAAATSNLNDGTKVPTISKDKTIGVIKVNGDSFDEVYHPDEL